MPDPIIDWDPWEAAATYDDLEIVEADLDGHKGAWQRDRLGDIIVLDPSLSPIEQRAVLTHELIHAERGIGWGAASAETMEREEAIVRREVAARLVPTRLLAHLVRECEVLGPVDAGLIARIFEVPHDVAELAASELRYHSSSDQLRRDQ